MTKLGDAFGPGSCASHGAASASPPSAAIPIAEIVERVARTLHASIYGPDNEDVVWRDLVPDALLAIAAIFSPNKDNCWPAQLNNVAAQFDFAFTQSTRHHGFYESFYAGWRAAGREILTDDLENRRRVQLAQGIEARRAETAQQAPSQDESPVPEGNAP